MPRARPLDSYPSKYYIALFRKVIEEDKPFKVPCSRTQAASLRGELYSWRNAAESSRDEATSTGIDLTILRKVSMKIEDDGLVVLPTSHLMGPSLIIAALGGEPSDLETEAQAALKRLQSMVGESNGG